MKSFCTERALTWCLGLGLLCMFSSVGIYFTFSSQITDYNLAYRDKLYLMPPTPDETDRSVQSFEKQLAIEDRYRAEHKYLFDIVENREMLFDKILAGVEDRKFYAEHETYMLPWFIDADNWVAFKQQRPDLAVIYTAFVKEMKAVEFVCPEGHNPTKPVLQQMIQEAERKQWLYAGSLAGLGSVLLLTAWILRRGKEVRRV